MCPAACRRLETFNEAAAENRNTHLHLTIKLLLTSPNCRKTQAETLITE